MHIAQQYKDKYKSNGRSGAYICTRLLANRIRKRQVTFVTGHMMRREDLDFLITTGKSKEDEGRGNSENKF